MKIFKSMIMAFSLYSKIPMPQISWNEDSAEHAITFLPLIGIVTGAVSYLMLRITQIYELPSLFITMMLTLIPLLITGGFHLDGFMDVQDAMHSYQLREKKLEIMKDPHIGAFAVISAGALLIIWTGFLYLLVSESFEKGDNSFLIIFCISFALSRALCAFTSICSPKAKKDGMLNMETKKSRTSDLIFLILCALAALAFMLVMNVTASVLMIVVTLLHLLWYTRLCKSYFGGVTGDTAGFFVVTSETATLILLGLCSVLLL